MKAPASCMVFGMKLKIPLKNIQPGVWMYTKSFSKSPSEKKLLNSIPSLEKKRAANQFPAAIGSDVVSDLTLLLKYLSGRLPVSSI